MNIMMERSSIEPGTFFPILTRSSDVLKPDPAVCAQICKEWGIPTENVLMVGDELSDMKCGYYAGCHTCLMLNERANQLHEEDFLVDHQIDSLDQLIELVKKTHVGTPNNSPFLGPMPNDRFMDEIKA